MKNSRSYWGKFADEYNKIVGEEGDPNHKLIVNPLVINLLGDLKNKTVLDAGCGNGYLSMLIAKNAKEVIGVDFTEKLINIAKGKSKNVKNLAFQITDLENLPFAKNSFDLIMCNLVLMDVENLEIVISELSRVVKVNGALIISVIHPCFENPPETYSLENEKGQKIGRVIKDYFTTGLKIDEENNYQHFHYKISDYLNAFSEANLIIEKTIEPDSAKIMKSKEQYITPIFLIMKLRKIAENEQ